MNGLSNINVELTSRCNKSCSMCGRRKYEPEHGDMPLDMVRSIAEQIPAGIDVQLHNNGEPLLYPHLEKAITVFSRQNFVSLNTNGKLLCDQAEALQYLDSMAISIIPDDPEGENQLLTVQSYLELDIDKPKIIVFRILGEVDRLPSYIALAKEHGILLAYRQLHSPEGSFQYQNECTVPEIGICLEALHKLSIDRFGKVSPCVRFDPEGKHVIGNLKDESLEQIWEGVKRKEFLNHHWLGNRRKASPICATCSFWGNP